jgi:chorismate mutase
MDKNGEIEVVHKTIMRKKNFKTPNAVVQYEDVNEAFEAEYLEEKQIDALKKKAEKTGISYSILKQVYNRGMAAWRTGHRPGTTPQQWAFARVNSFATKSKGTWGGADKDLAAKARGSTKKEEVSEADPCWDGYKQVGMKKNASGKDVPNCVPESVELGESKYDLYHRDFSSAMQHAYKMAKKLHGITIDSKEIDDKVATGPRKPSEGKTNKYRLKGDKGDIQVQVYNKGGSKPFELNMYKEEVELDEAVKVGMMKLKDGKSVKVSPAEAKMFNDVLKELNPENRKRMESEMMKDQSSYKTMLTFAKRTA